jgi:hypothetical protein
MKQIRCEHGWKADEYRYKIPPKSYSKTQASQVNRKTCFPNLSRLLGVMGGVWVGCFDSSIWQYHILGLLDWPYQKTIKQKFHIIRKRKLPFPHLFRRKTLSHFRFHFRQKNSVSISVPQISVSVFIFSFCFYFSAEKSENFCSTFIPSRNPIRRPLHRIGGHI